ncbi:hypothetical protein BDN72DRAFT_887027 [Pluteus cervinus]|uniref:Uncharacterized protein n=1 Tax=Pluteus cervinus TaxID=181527 RepID=A0ACD3B3N3_9AGAR|nr:hypothetical protein BDN72DRAFT_887027 [Pluteus cervinus]
MQGRDVGIAKNDKARSNSLIFASQGAFDSVTAGVHAASLSMSQPTLTTKPDLLLQRPPSALSVASNTSAASGSSLIRRSRTRARSKTMAGEVGHQEGPHNRSPSSELPYLDRTLVQDHSPNPSSLETLALPPKGPSPSRPPHRSDGSDGIRGIANSLQQNERELMEGPSLEGSPAVNVTELKPAQLNTTSQVPFPDVEPVFSTYYRPPSLTRINVRDSVLTHNSYSTQQSGTSSSLYPPSTSTASGTESPPSPRSMALQEDDYAIEPMVDEPEEYEGDDVSYRLRLLVKNNYFLPPAHSKPSPSDFATLNAPKRPARATTPTFLDLFKVGKSKTKPATPPGTTDGPPPMLRTAADSPTASAYVRPQPRSSAQIPRVPQQPGNTPRQPSGRVVVVREKMADIIVAAKQAEQEMKSRGTRREQEAAPEQQEPGDDVIDPTDVVDVPLPASGYPFAVQASALHGLGVQESLGAAVLADRLPPPRSIDVSSSFDTDESWRKALLQQAVHHSLDTSPDISSFSILGATSTPIASPRTSGQMTSRGPSPSAKLVLDQYILSPRIIEKDEEPEETTPRRPSTHSQRSNKAPLPPLHLTTPAIPESQTHSARSSYLPLRVDTPTAPMTPLTPPPRRPLMINPMHSQSQTDLSRTSLAQEIPRPSSATPHVRRAKSSPMLSDSYEHSTKRDTLFTPPPLPATIPFYRVASQDIFGLSSSGNTSFDSARSHLHAPSITTSESRYSVDSYVEDVDNGPRVSMALSAMNERPSISEYSQPSPSSYAFPEMRTGRSSLASTVPGSARASVEQPAFQTSTPRFSATSPPPRVSSSLAHFALSPPPRPGQAHRRFSPQLSTPASFAERRVSPISPLRNHAQIFAPEPTTPPLPIAERRNTRTPPSLTIPTTDIPIAIRSAPGPSSPTSFFDTIQTQPNAMDDLESSSDESEDEQNPDDRSPYDDDRGPTTLFVDPRTRAISNITAKTPRPNIVLPLGNHSSPHIARPSGLRRPSLPFGVKDAKKPIEFTPSKPQYFTERKSDHGHAPPSPLDSFKHAPPYSPTRPSEPGSSSLAPMPRRSTTAAEQRDNVRTWQSSQRAQESLRRLDGMLIQHMEAEKDTIKRIATTLRSTSTSRT